MSESLPTASDWRPRFFLIWSGQLVSMLGSSVAQFALVWWLTKQTGAATTLTTAMMMAVLPQVLLGPFLGAYVDRHDRRLLMIGADALVAAAALWLGWLFWAGSIQVWHIYLAAFIRSVGGGLHWPAMTASTALMVPERHLTRVTGVNHAVGGALGIIGPPLGAWLVELWTMPAIMLVDVVTAAVAVTPLLFVRIPSSARKESPAGMAGLWGEAREGLHFLWQWRAMRWLVIGAMAVNFLLGPGGALLPLLVTQHFGGGATQLGWIQAGWAGGIVLGGLILGAWGGFKRKMLTTLPSLALMGAGFVVIGLAPREWFWLAVAANLLAGTMNPLVNGPIHALMQSTVPAGLQGRVFTAVGSACGAMMPLSLALAGPIGDWVGVRSWYFVGGLACVVMAAAALTRRELRDCGTEAMRSDGT
jgi:DHA3 family macrolide efflux protein-like MFS transporter